MGDSSSIWLISTMGDDRPVPCEGAPRNRIGAKPVAVRTPLSNYYHRRLRDGELREATATEINPPAAATAPAAPVTPSADPPASQAKGK